MKETILRTKAGIKWTFTETLDDLDFAEDMHILLYCYGDIQIKSENLDRDAGKTVFKIGLKINTNKKGTAKQYSNSRSHNYWSTYHWRARDDWICLSWTWGKGEKYGNSEFEFKSNVLGVLLYAAGTWKVTKGICQMLEVVRYKCLTRILRIYWPIKISNKKLHERTGYMACTDAAHLSFSSPLDILPKYVILITVTKHFTIIITS